MFAARVALAAREQGKFEAFHWALMGMQGRAREASVLSVAEVIGLDIERLRADMEAREIEEQIATSMQLTQPVGFNGTPSFVIADTLIPGFEEEEQLRSTVDDTRGGR